MALADARRPGGAPLALPDGPPYAAAALPRGSFTLPPGDPRLQALFDGQPAQHPSHDNLVGATRWWHEHRDWMDFLDPESPTHQVKMVERALYLDLWAPYLQAEAPRRALDLGCGVGRMSQWLLEEGLTVELVDPDLRSLQAAYAMARAVGQGALDLHWTTGESLPDLDPVDLAVAAEVLCYCEDAPRVVANLARVVRPGGLLLCSVEARWGWAMAADAAPGSLPELFREDGLVHVAGDRWVRTFDEAQLRALLEPAFVIEVLRPSHYTFSGPFETAAGELSFEETLAMEARLRAHPVLSGLNRAWIVVARRSS
jgi:SAM-dependent methyltransferase